MRVGDAGLKLGIGMRRLFAGWRKNPSFNTFERAQRMMHHRVDLEAERQHVGRQPRLHDCLGIDTGRLTMCQPLVEHTGQRAENLNISSDTRFVK